MKWLDALSAEMANLMFGRAYGSECEAYSV